MQYMSQLVYNNCFIQLANMSCPKSIVKSQIPQQTETFTMQLTKKMANYIKGALPLRYTLQIYSKKNDRNSLNSGQPSKKNGKSNNKEKSHVKVDTSISGKSKEKISGNTDESQIKEIKPNQFQSRLKQKGSILSDQKQITLLKDQITELLEDLQKSLPKDKDRFAKIKVKFQNNIYKKFTQFEVQIKAIRDKINSENPNVKGLKEFSKIHQKVQLYFKSLSSKKKQHNHKLQTQKKIAQKKIEPNVTKSSKYLKKTIKITEKQMKATKEKPNGSKQNVPLTKDLFEVSEENESATNSRMHIDSFEAGSINQLIKKLHRFDQYKIMESLTQKCGIRFLRNLTRGQATDLVTKIKKILRGYEEVLADKDMESSFQIESDE